MACESRTIFKCTSSCHHNYHSQDRMTQQQLQAACTCLRNVLISTVVTQIAFYIIFGVYWTVEAHHDPDREILLQFLFGWIETDEL